MQFTHVPEPPSDLADIEGIASAVPETAHSETNCCALLVDHTRVPTTDEAWTWLAFLRALRVVTETQSGLRRTVPLPGESELRRSFRTRVYGAQDVYDALDGANEPRSVAAVVADVDETIPPTRRGSGGGEQPSQRDYVRRLLEWWVLFGDVERVDDGYGL